MTANPFSQQGIEELARMARRMMHAYAAPTSDADPATLERCDLTDVAWAVRALAVGLDTGHSLVYGTIDSAVALGHPRLAPTLEAARRCVESGFTLKDALGEAQVPVDARVKYVVGLGEMTGCLHDALRNLGELLAWEGALERRYGQVPEPQTEAEKVCWMRFEGAWGAARLARNLHLMLELEPEIAPALRACASALGEPWTALLLRVADGLANNPSLAVLDRPESPLPELFAQAVERARVDGDLLPTLQRLGEYYGGIAEHLIAEATTPRGIEHPHQRPCREHEAVPHATQDRTTEPNPVGVGAMRAWGVDFGGAALTAVRLHSEGEGVAVDAYFRIAYEGAEAGSVPAWAFRAAVSAFLQRHPDAGAGMAVVSPPPPEQPEDSLPAIIKVLETPRDADGSPRPLGAQELHDYIPYPAAEVVWDQFAPGDEPAQRLAMVVLRRDNAEKAVQKLAEAGLNPAAMSLAHVAGLAWVRSALASRAKAGTALLNIGTGGCHLAIFGDAGLHYLRDMWKVDAALFAPQGADADGLAAAIENLLNFVDKTRTFYVATEGGDASAPSSVVLLGDSPHIEALAVALRERFGGDVLIPSEPAALSLMIEADGLESSNATWLPGAAVALGFALQGLGRVPGVDLRPPVV